jgi:hypothetical protein
MIVVQTSKGIVRLKFKGSRTTPGPTPDVYAFHRGSTQRNLYRIPIP